MSITRWLSTCTALQSRPTSLANPTLRACQALSAYLTISAVSMSVRTSGAARPISVAVHVHGLAEPAHLVGEPDLEGMPGVIGVLDHLCRLDVGAHQRRRQADLGGCPRARPCRAGPPRWRTRP